MGACRTPPGGCGFPGRVRGAQHGARLAHRARAASCYGSDLFLRPDATGALAHDFRNIRCTYRAPGGHVRGDARGLAGRQQDRIARAARNARIHVVCDRTDHCCSGRRRKSRMERCPADDAGVVVRAPVHPVPRARVVSRVVARTEPGVVPALAVAAEARTERVRVAVSGGLHVVRRTA